MNREQKAAAVAEIAEQLKESEAVFAVDYRGISVPQAAALRVRLREADATFRVVKNTLTERAADEAGVESLKTLLQGPTALTFVRGDAALAAKAISTLARETDTLAFKGGLLNGDTLDPDQITAISRLPSRDVLYGQLVGMVAAPITGVVRTLNALISGLALQLGQINEKKASGEIPAGEGPAAQAAPAAATEERTGDEPPAQDTPDQDAEAPEPAAAPEQPAESGADEDTPSENDNEADASA